MVISISYDIRICVKVEGCDKYAVIGTPEHDSPTYNLSSMFRACMDWDYSQGKIDDTGRYDTCYYPCDFAIDKVETGIRELRTKRKKYEKYEPENGWGSIDSAVIALESIRECIYECAEEIPIDRLYMRW